MKTKKLMRREGARDRLQAQMIGGVKLVKDEKGKEVLTPLSKKDLTRMAKEIDTLTLRIGRQI